MIRSKARELRSKGNSAQANRSLVPKHAVNNDTTKPLSLTVLQVPSKPLVNHLIFIPSHDLLLTDNYVFKLDSTGFPIALSDGSDHRFGEMVNICKDIVASVDKLSGKSITWHAATNKIVAELQIPESNMFHATGPSHLCVKITEEQLVVGRTDGQYFVIEHFQGNQLRVVHNFKSKRPLYMVAHDNLLVVLSFYSMTLLNIDSSFKELHSIQVDNILCSVAVSASHIFVGCRNGELRFYLNESDFPIDFVLDAKVGVVLSILILTDDVVACVGSNGCISFLSISKKNVSNVMKVSQHLLLNAVVLGDGQIAVAGESGFCATFFAPSPLQDAVQECALRLYPYSGVGRRLHPFRSSWLRLQHSIVSSKEACDVMARTENGPSSLDEWVFGHNILMQAIKDGAVPTSPDFKNQNNYWLMVLYIHCPKLATEKQDLSLVLTILREAQQAGVIKEVETVVHNIFMRRDMKKNIAKGQRFMVNAVYELFMHQAEQDGRLQELLRWKRVQQLTGVVNALLACVPFCGSLLTSAVGAGVTVLTDVNLKDLVDGLLSGGKDFGGELMTDKLVGLFVNRSNVLLSEEEWEKIPESQRKYVEAAAGALGMTIEELRGQLLKAANSEVPTTADEVPGTDVFIEELENSGDKADLNHDWDETEAFPLLTAESPAEASHAGGRLEASDELIAESNLLNEQLRTLRKEFEAKLEKIREDFTKTEETVLTRIIDVENRMRAMKEEKK